MKNHDFISPSDVNKKLEILSNPSASVETKKWNVELLLTLSVKNSDFTHIVKESNGILILTTLFKTTKDFDLKTKITTLLIFLSLSGYGGATTENLMSDMNVMSLVNLFQEKSFSVIMQAFGGLKLLGEDPSLRGGDSGGLFDKKSVVSFSLATTILFLENIIGLISCSSKLLSDDQKTDLLVNFAQLIRGGVMDQAIADAAKNSNAALSKNFTLAYEKFVKSLEGNHKGDLSKLDMITGHILRLIKDGKLFAAAARPPLADLLDNNLTTINNWLGGSKEFNLLYKSSRDGLSSTTFHTKCDNKGATVTVITSSDGSVFGGYAAVSWSSSGYYVADNSRQSFLFSLKKSTQCAAPAKFDLANPNYAIYDVSTHLPSFGNGHDITAGDHNSQTYTHLGCIYSNPTGLAGETVFTGQRNYTVKDIEVYQVQ